MRRRPLEGEKYKRKIENTQRTMATKTLVNIVDPTDPIPTYLFVKEHYAEGDRMLLIAAASDGEAAAHMARQLAPREVQLVVMKRESDDYTYERICRRIYQSVDHGAHYYVNLSGGSRYMALAVQRVMECFDSEFFYTQTRENLIVSTIFDHHFYDNDDVFFPIGYHMEIGEYLQLHGLQHSLDRGTHLPIRPYRATRIIFDLFAHGRLSAAEHSTIGLLREEYRGNYDTMSMRQLMSHGIGRHNPVPGLNTLLRRLRFEPEVAGQLSRAEVDYLTGGWLEEYVYHVVCHKFRPDQAAIGVQISRPGVPHDNELDVVFIRNNQLFVVECKTGIQSVHMFNEIVYKATALRQSLLGISSHSYIFSLRPDSDGRLHQTAALMGIQLCDPHDLTGRNLYRLLQQVHRLSDPPQPAAPRPETIG